MFSEFAFDHGQPTPWEYKQCGGGELKVGTPLKIDTGSLAKGKLVAATGSDKPDYISMSGGEFAAGDTIAVIPVVAGKKYVTIAKTQIHQPKSGTKYDISEDGEGIVTAADGGVVTLLEWDGDPNGNVIGVDDKVVVKF